MLLTGVVITSSLLYAGLKAYAMLRAQKGRVAPVWQAGQAHAGDKAATMPLAHEIKSPCQPIQPTLALAQTPEEGTAIAPLTSGDVEPDLDRHLTVSSLALGVASCGALMYTPLSWLSVPGIIYTSIPIFRAARDAARQDGRVRVATLDAIATLGCLSTGHFVGGALTCCLYYVGEKLLNQTKDHTCHELVNVFRDHPHHVVMLRDGGECLVPFSAVQAGDVVVVQAGETIPVDGAITTGMASINQQILTGEAQPVEKSLGDPVFASTVILSGRICMVAQHTADDTLVAHIGAILNATTTYKSSLQLQGEQVADQAVLPVLALSALALPTLGLQSAIAALYTSLGDHLKLVAPVSVLNFLRLASRRGILIKDGRSLDLLRRVDTVVFDKTGTLTLEHLDVQALYTCHGYAEDAVLAYAAAAESRQSHPLARAIVQAAQLRRLAVPDIDDAQYQAGYGLKVRIGDRLIRVGSARFMAMEGIAVPGGMARRLDACRANGDALVMVSINAQLGGAIALRPALRPEAQRMIQRLKARGLSTYIMSGDHETPTQRLAEALGVDHYVAEVLPEEKARWVEALQHQNKSVCYVGDGINDAIALKTAHVSVSLRGAATVATDTAQIVMLEEGLSQLDQLFAMADELAGNVQHCWMATVVPGLICIGGVFFLHLGISGAIVLYNLGFLGGLANAMWPRLRQQLAGPHTPLEISA